LDQRVHAPILSPRTLTGQADTPQSQPEEGFVSWRQSASVTADGRFRSAARVVPGLATTALRQLGLLVSSDALPIMIVAPVRTHALASTGNRAHTHPIHRSYRRR